MLILRFPWQKCVEYVTDTISGATIFNVDVSEQTEQIESLLGLKTVRGALKEHQVVSLPATIDLSGESMVAYSSTLRSSSEVKVGDAISKAIEAYNNFDIATAVQSFEEACALEPNNKQALFNLASIMHMVDLPTLAVGYILRLLLEDPDDHVAHSFLWALNRTGDCDKCTVDAYKQLAGLGDLRAVTKLAALTGAGSQAARGDPAYAEQIYDDMAEKFEGKLVNHLGYRGPWLMLEQLESLYSQAWPDPQAEAETHNSSANTKVVNVDEDAVSGRLALLRLRRKGEWRILDVGCGSGLVGKVFAAYVGKEKEKEMGSSGCSTSTTNASPSVMSSTEVTAEANSSGSSGTFVPAAAAEAVAVPNMPRSAAATTAGPKRPLLCPTLAEVCTTPGPLMVGIDVSQRMAEITAATGLYDGVHHADLSAALRQLDCTAAPANTSTSTQQREEEENDRVLQGNTSSTGTKIGLDMVVAADTFIYVGALGEVFQLVRRVLRGPEHSINVNGGSDSCGDENKRERSEGSGGGLFMFTTEDLDESPMRVRQSRTPDHSSTATTGVASNTSALDLYPALDMAQQLPPTSSSSSSSNADIVEHKSNKGEGDAEGEIAGAVPGWGAQLLTSARFAHSDRYVRALCVRHGFRVLCHQKIVLRTEETVPLPGNIYILQKLV